MSEKFEEQTMQSSVVVDAPLVDVSENVVASTEIVQVESDVESFATSIDELQNNVDALLKDLRNVSLDLKNHKKKYWKIMKTINKNKSKRSSDGKKKEPSGFVSPIGLSDALCEFMQLEKGIKIPRTVVTKYIIAYIKEHKLESKQNGRNFDLTDSSDPHAVLLKNLFKIENGDEVNYFNLQSYLKQHFVQTTPEEKTIDSESNSDSGEPKKLRIKKQKTKV